MVSLLEALEKIDSLEAQEYKEVIPVEQALDRVAAREYTAQFDLPRFDNSAMDGYAVKTADAGKTVRVSEVVYAGEDKDGAVQSGCAVKIMTGAVLPAGCEAVVPEEHVTAEGESITLPEGLKPQANMRFRGEDVAKGSVVLKRGAECGAYDIAMLTSQGISHITVYKRLKTAVFASGEELKPHYENVAGHQLYNSNSPTIAAMLEKLGCDVTYLNSAKDNKEALRAMVQNCLDAQLIVTTGGASVGDRDYTKEVLLDLGAKPVFEKIAIKPGKPTTLYMLGQSYVLVLPGNPLAAMVNFEVVGKALVKRLQHRTKRYFQPLYTKLATGYQKKPGRDTLVFGTFDGRAFTPLDKQLPGMVGPLQKAQALAVMEAQIEKLDCGEKIKIIPLQGESFSATKSDIFNRENVSR